MADLSQLAYRIVQRAMQPQETETMTRRSGAGRRLVGREGQGRSLTAEGPYEIARRAAQTRWGTSD
jgi:hypothetical protein